MAFYLIYINKLTEIGKSGTSSTFFGGAKFNKLKSDN